MYYFNLEERNASYLKTVRVIRSCRTTSQLTVAMKFTNFFLKGIPAHQRSEFASQLKSMLKAQNLKINWHYGA